MPRGEQVNRRRGRPGLSPDTDPRRSRTDRDAEQPGQTGGPPLARVHEPGGKGEPGILSFAGGIPDPKLFPMGAVSRACADILADPLQGPQALQYSLSEGYPPLRRWIADRMAARGVPCDIENIVVTGGSQQGLDYLGKLLLSPGDTALVTAPTYLGALQAFNAYEPRYDTIDLDGNMTPAAYEAAAAGAGGRVAFAYVVPDFANPTGETMTERAREALLDQDGGDPGCGDRAVMGKKSGSFGPVSSGTRQQKMF